MGALLGNQCFETNAQAVDAFFSSKDPSYTSGSTSYLSWFEKVGGVWQVKRQSISSTGTVTNLTSSDATIPTFPVCDPLASFTDGIALGWLIVGLMVAAYGAVMIRRQLV